MTRGRPSRFTSPPSRSTSAASAGWSLALPLPRSPCSSALCAFCAVSSPTSGMPMVGRAAIRVPVLVSATHRAAAHRRRAHATAHAHAARAALAFMDARYLVLVVLAGVIAALHFVHRHGALSGIAQSQVTDLGDRHLLQALRGDLGGARGEQHKSGHCYAHDKSPTVNTIGPR